ncbi:MAG TPA: diphthine--ammonia ligase [Pedobacter sp.]|uniref:Dph6-related ATP pyrophosphatase n=1 Tax=Pedobacter sp. TaxID=1411316 RepID=UPI002C05A41C|nr:diphthine--ammonia ligase [Pedobacter sp.]HMI04728.1 diphthine--ammonia ligase [Pedobacter sp.]
MKNKCLFNWSGGKDSTLALHYALQDPSLRIDYLLTTVNDAFDRVSMHGVRSSLLIRQAESIGIDLYQVRLPEMPGMDTYEQAMQHHLGQLKSKGITHSLFGDIFLEDLKLYRENKLAEIGMTALFPLWKRDTTELLREFISLGYKTVVVCAKKGLEDFCGRVIDERFIDELPEGIDPCGENGEFHTFAFEGPIFKRPIPFELGEKVFKTYETAEIKDAGYWYIDLLPV